MNLNAAMDLLVAEHKTILKVVYGLQRAGQSLRAGNYVSPILLGDAVIFMREFADRRHHAKEEDILFPALVAHGVPLHGCPIDALLHEHEKGRCLIKEISTSLDLYENNLVGAGIAIAEAIEGIVELYPNHIWKEDDMVFPMVERLFSEVDRLELYQKFQEVDARMEQESHKRFCDFAEKFLEKI